VQKTNVKILQANLAARTSLTIWAGVGGAKAADSAQFGITNTASKQPGQVVSQKICYQVSKETIRKVPGESEG